MVLKNDYNECITNLACSIRKHFDLEYKHNTLDYVDKILDKNKPKNVVVILFDGMGSRILDRTLDKNDFFIKNKYKEITSVFPATTTAATTSMMTGLNPVEHGYTGWFSYIKPIDEVIALFTGENKVTQMPSDKWSDIKKKYFNYKIITEEINDAGKYRSRILFPFGEDSYKDLDNMLSIIKEECAEEGKKFIYAYDEEPDHTMHDVGPDSDEVKKLIKIRNDKVEKLCDGLKDTIVFIVADHGHIKVDNIDLNDYPDVTGLLERTPSMETRAISFKVKVGKNKEFEEKFNKHFGKYFNLYNKSDIIDSKLFGDGDEHPLFRDAISDYIAIAENSNKSLVSEGDVILYSHHAGYTDDEVYIPLIIVNKVKLEKFL